MDTTPTSKKLDNAYDELRGCLDAQKALRQQIAVVKNHCEKAFLHASKLASYEGTADDPEVIELTLMLSNYALTVSRLLKHQKPQIVDTAPFVNRPSNK